MGERIFVQSDVQDMILDAERRGAEAMLATLGQFGLAHVTEYPTALVTGEGRVDAVALIRAWERQLGRW